MPPKEKEGKKEKKINLVNGQLPSQIVFKLRKTYERNCTQDRSLASRWVVDALQECKETERLLTMAILQRVPATKPDDSVVSVDPFIQALQQCRYVYLQKLYVWGVPICFRHIANMCIWLKKPVYPLQRLELMNCYIDAEAVKRLAEGISHCHTITEVCLDHNEFGDKGCEGLCSELMNNTYITSLSLRYCELKSKSGTDLGKLLCTTAIQEMFLEGNELSCSGAIDLVKYCAAQAFKEYKAREDEAKQREEEERRKQEELERARQENPLGMRQHKAEDEPQEKKKKSGKKGKGPPPPPKIGPWVVRLNLFDNCIDNILDKEAALHCMRQIGIILRYSDCIEEINLKGNSIGDLAGRELVDALTERQAEKLPPVKVETTYRMACSTYESILELGGGPKKKKGKGKK